MKPLAETATYRVVRSQYNIWTKNIYGGKKYSVPVQGFSNFIPRQVATKPKFLHSQYREELVEHFWQLLNFQANQTSSRSHALLMVSPQTNSPDIKDKYWTNVLFRNGKLNSKYKIQNTNSPDIKDKYWTHLLSRNLIQNSKGQILMFR